MISDALRESSHEPLVTDVLNSGYHIPVLTLLDGYHAPSFDEAQIQRDARVIIEELHREGIMCPASLAGDVGLMRSIMVPTSGQELGLALSRIWTYAVLFDDVFALQADLPFEILGGQLAGGARISPYTKSIDYMFGKISSYCDPEFLGFYKAYLFNWLQGVILESTFSPDGTDSADTDYIRERSGACEFWYLTLQFSRPSLRFRQSMPMWASTMRLMVHFLNDINDVLSFCKEAVNGADFTASSIYRMAVRHDIPYRDAYRYIAHRGITCYAQILQLADTSQRACLERYMKGFIYWHLNSDRYMWRQLLVDCERDQARAGGGGPTHSSWVEARN